VFFFVFSIIKAELWWMHEVNPVSKSIASLGVTKQNPLSFHKIKSSDFTQSIFVYEGIKRQYQPITIY